MDILGKDLDDLKYAKSLMENPGLAAKITNLLGAPIEKGFDLLPKDWSEIVSSSTRKALQVAVHSAILTMNTKKEGRVLPMSSINLWSRVPEPLAAFVGFLHCL